MLLFACSNQNDNLVSLKILLIIRQQLIEQLYQAFLHNDNIYNENKVWDKN